MIRSKFFSEEEKDIIKLIADNCASEPVCILDFLKENFFIDNALLYNPQKRLINLAIPITNPNRLIEISKLWDLFILIQYLEDNFFISSMPFNGDKSKSLKCVWSKAPTDFQIVDGAIKFGQDYTWIDGKFLEKGKLIMQCYSVPEQFYDHFELLFKYIHATKRLFDLIECDFKSFDELALEELKQQSQKLEDLAKEIKKQSNELKTQSKEAKNQSNELKTQSEEAKNQSKELKIQSREARKQTLEASKQSKEANRQTTYSLFVFIISLITLLLSCKLNSCNNTSNSKQETSQTAISVIDSSLNIYVKDSISSELKSIKAYTQDIRHHQNDSVILKTPLQSKGTSNSPKNRVFPRTDSRSINKAGN